MSYPLYIVSKGRADSRYTSKALEAMHIDYHIVIEEQEYKQYSAVIDKKKIVVLDKTYQEKYDTLDDLGLTKSVGPGAARNFAWDHSISLGAKRHWVMDDNIRGFFRFNKNKKIQVLNNSFFKIMDDFVDRYENVGMAGPNYYMFIPARTYRPPFITNTRIYSCNMILNELPHRWRGRYNEDTILSIDIMKDGWVTVQFNAFLQNKINTQQVKGGNTAEFYAKEGTGNKSEMLYKVYPEYTELAMRYGRKHHYINYKKHFTHRLIKRKDIKIDKDTNNYGMELKQIC